MTGAIPRPGALARDRAIPRIRSFAIRARPCRHDLAGKPHEHLSEIYRCIERNGNPGIQLVEESL